MDDMRFRRAHTKIAVLGASIALLTGPLGGSAEAAVAASGPAGFVAGFATPVVVIAEGEGITFVNADFAQHDFVADGVFVPRKAAKKSRWCSGFDKGECPLFWSPRISAGQTTEVEGVEKLKAGNQYPFKCTLHSAMRGTLVVR